MKKIVRQQNYLKELIEAQENRFLSRQALMCLVRSALEPLLDNPETGVVLYRIENKNGLTGLLKRLEFSDIESYSYSDNSENLLEKVWANTEFLVVMTHRYVSVLIWDNNTGDKNFVRYYSLYNSKLQKEALDIIKRNSKIDISPYQEKFNPDRRDNILLNESIKKLLENMDEAANDAVLGFAEKNAENSSDKDFESKKVRVVSHEIKNQLSICDLYCEIIRKYAEKGNDKGIAEAVKTVGKAIKMASNSLLSLKSDEKQESRNVSLKSIIDEAVELSKVYIDGRDIDFQVLVTEDITVIANSENLKSVLINLVKNAAEAFPVEEFIGAPQNGKYIRIEAGIDGDGAIITVSNNAVGIKEPEKIFKEGFTTKSTGNGLGLWICKKLIESQSGSLELSRSSDDYTEFTIRLGIAEE